MKETRRKDDTQTARRYRGPVQCLFAALVFCVLLFIHGGAQALDVPPLKYRVNDYANMISPGVRAQLEKELKDFEQSDSTQIVILTIESLEGESLEEFSIKVAETWKIGRKGKDNGAVLLVAKKDRKTRIEVGRGLEGRLTDLTAGRIVQLVINPQFKRGDFDGGFSSGIRAMIDATRGEFKADNARPRAARKTGLSSVMPFSHLRSHIPPRSGKDVPHPGRRGRFARLFSTWVPAGIFAGDSHSSRCSRPRSWRLPSLFVRR